MAVETKMICDQKLIRKAGTGTYGEVYIVESTAGERSAIKLESDLEDVLTTYATGGIRHSQLTEIQILSGLRHPHLLYGKALLPPTQCDGKLGISLPAADMDLESYIAILAPLSDEAIPHKLRILFEVGSALAFLHQQHILHLDIKLGNVLMFKDISMLADFGISTYVEKSTVPTVSSLPAYGLLHRAPENWESKMLESGTQYLSTISEVWAYGIFCLELLSNNRVFADLYAYGYENDVDKVHTYIETYFKPDVLIKTLTTYLDDKSDLIKLVARMLDWDPRTRITLFEVLTNPVFGAHTPIPGIVVPVTIVKDSLKIPKSLLLTLQRAAVMVFPSKSVHLLFVAYDLVYRTYRQLSTPQTRAQHAITCLWIAGKFLDGEVGLVELMNLQKVGGITLTQMLEMELAIILWVTGVIYRPYLYEVCRSAADVRAALTIAQTSNLYISIDPAVWIANRPVPLPDSPSKDFQLRQL